MTIEQLLERVAHLQRMYPGSRIKAQGWNESGDLMDFYIKGDLRIERDMVGNPVLVLR